MHSSGKLEIKSQELIIANSFSIGSNSPNLYFQVILVILEVEWKSAIYKRCRLDSK